MRILLVAPPWFAVPPSGYGGIEQVVALLADGLADAGHDVTLLASGGSATRARLRTVFSEPPSARLGDPVLELTHLLEPYLDSGTYDVIHDHTLIGAALGAVRGTTPVVHTLHGPWTEDTLRVYARLGGRVNLVAISHHQASRAAGVPITGVVHNGIDLDRFPVHLEREGHLAFVGRANREKGPEVALEVARRTGRRLAMAIKVNEPEEHAYFDQVVVPAMEGVSVEVRTDARASEVARIMGSARALVVPIQWDEPFGMVMAEAGACGTPVVAFARGAAPEIVVDGSTGFLVDKGDIEGLCEAVERADEIEPAACRRRIANHFSSARMVDGYLRLYERVLHLRAADDVLCTVDPAIAGSTVHRSIR